MISRIRILGYRCIYYADVQVPRFALLVGPNGSGKSSLLDALLFVRDLLAHGAEEAIFRRAAELEDLIWMREPACFEICLDLRLPEEVRVEGRAACRYALRVGRDPSRAAGVVAETLWLCRDLPAAEAAPQPTVFPVERKPPDTLFRPAPKTWRVAVRKTETGNDYFRSETGKWNIQFRVGPSRPALASIPEDESKFPSSLWVRRFLRDGIQHLQLASLAMRRPVSPLGQRRFEPDGSNLPLVIDDLRRRRPDNYKRWVAHLQTVLPDLESVEVVTREEDRARYLALQYASGLRVPAWSVSDGTLRMLALTLLAYADLRDALFCVEEPENGLHPLAIDATYQSLSSVYDGQVLVATHNPVLVSLAGPEEILVFGRTPRGAADIVRGLEHPALRDWKRDVDLGTLAASGILG